MLLPSHFPSSLATTWVGTSFARCENINFVDEVNFSTLSTLEKMKKFYSPARDHVKLNSSFKQQKKRFRFKRERKEETRVEWSRLKVLFSCDSRTKKQQNALTNNTADLCSISDSTMSIAFSVRERLTRWWSEKNVHVNAVELTKSGRIYTIYPHFRSKSVMRGPGGGRKVLWYERHIQHETVKLPDIFSHISNFLSTHFRSSAKVLLGAVVNV